MLNLDTLMNMTECASKGATRQYLQGVYVEDNGQTYVATDGTVMAVWRGMPRVEGLANVIIKTEAIKAAWKGYSKKVKDKNVRLEGTSLVTDTMTINNALIDAVFPNYQAVMPKSGDLEKQCGIFGIAPDNFAKVAAAAGVERYKVHCYDVASPLVVTLFSNDAFTGLVMPVNIPNVKKGA